MNTLKDFAAVANIDLKPIKAKLMHVASGEGWSQERVDAIEKEYRRFLYLMMVYPHEQTSPSVDVDIFWHYHILDTAKYAADCEQAFGYFLHHYPYVGMEGADDDALVHSRSGERMRELYESTFGEAYPGGAAYCGSTTAAADDAGATAAAAYCGAARTPAYCGATKVKRAYCGAAATETAYCGVAGAGSASACSKKPAYCGVAIASAAYCGVTSAQGAAGRMTNAKAAYCGIANNKHAYCGVANGKAAYCGIASGKAACCGVTEGPGDDVNIAAPAAAVH